MRRTVYVLLFCLCMGYLACFSSFTQNALAAPQVNAVSTSEKQAYYQHNRQITHVSEDFSQHAFTFPWPAIKIPDLSSLWKQQHDKQKKKDIFDLGE